MGTKKLIKRYETSDRRIKTVRSIFLKENIFLGRERNSSPPTILLIIRGDDKNGKDS